MNHRKFFVLYQTQYRNFIVAIRYLLLVAAIGRPTILLLLSCICVIAYIRK